MSFAVHIAIITALDIAGTVAAKYWSITKHPLFLLATFLLFGSAGFVFAKSLKYEGVAITNVLWIALSVAIITILGFFLFKEDILPIQFIGIGIIIVGLIVINLK